MDSQLPAREALGRLLRASWDPASLPEPKSIPWPEVLRLAVPGNVAASVYTVVRDISEGVPSSARRTLEEAYYRCAAANTRGLYQLAHLQDGLADVGTPLLLLKGAALGETLYGDVALRPMGDIDLAVPVQAVSATGEALLEMGYSQGQPEHRAGSLIIYGGQELFTPPSPQQIDVELHWHVLSIPYYLRRVPMDWFWDNTESLTVAGRPFRVLNLEANLIYLPAHLALHHGFHGWHSLLDLALLVTRNADRLQWEKVIAAATSFELLNVLRSTLDRLAGVWPSLPLDDPRRQLRDLQPSGTDTRLFRLLTAESRTPTLDFYTTLVSLPDLGERARYAWTNLFPQPAYMIGRYRVQARWQLPYWYLFRLGQGLTRLARSLPRARRIDRGGG